MFNISQEVAVGDRLPLFYVTVSLVKNRELEGRCGWVRRGSIGEGSKVSVVVGH